MDIGIAAKDTEIDTITGLDSGADDYIIKPFAVMELGARIRSLFRRADKSEKQSSDNIQMSDLFININTREVMQNQKLINLTYKEKDWLTKLTLSAAENSKHESDVKLLSNAAGGNRITIITPNGTVIADSEINPLEMENHAEREEVKYAKINSVTISTRNSSTTGQDFMYASIITEDGNILRLAHEYSGLFQNLIAQIPAVLTAIIITFILSLFFAFKFTKAITKPLENMVDALTAHEYEKFEEYNSPYYEIDKMMKTLQKLLQKINDSNKKLQSEQGKVETILESMAEGFVFVDNKMNILLCNNSARNFFTADSEIKLDNIYNLTRSQNIINTLQSVIEKEQSAVFDTKLKNNIIANIYISPSKITENELGAIILIIDITAQKQLEQQKRDFFSNASHELKTPITSIIGFSEMLNKEMVQSEKEKMVIMHRIENEAKRMSELINDILTISKLESNTNDADIAEFDFKNVIEEAVAAISPVINNKTVEINTDLDNILFTANKRQIYELCVNLIENAVKYNKPNGKVDISLKTKDDNIILTVKDTGIGIPLEYQPRIFERFYRVDYGRDKKIGGTGLGLSIVKHIVSIYNGKISLQSKKNNGTAITVELPISQSYN